jgi:methylglutaconyl-CoA hydratase
MEFFKITYAVSKKVATITLNCPELHNALDTQTIAELSYAFTQVQKDQAIKVVILRAEGESFCAGVDASYLKQIAKYDFNQNLQDSSDLMRLLLQIYTLRKPVIASVQGPALAVGCGLAVVCDFVIAAKETVTVGFPEVTLGFIPALILIFLSRRIGEGRARDLVLSGSIISAEEASQIGLVSQVVPLVDLERTTKQLAELLKTKNSSSSMGLIKELFSRAHGMSTNDALDYASNLNALARMTDDCKKGIEAFLNNETIKW